MTTRRPLTRAQRVRIFDRHGGICHVCREKIHVNQRWEAEHVVPLWAGGSDSPDNMAPIHLDPCHREKSGEEAGDRAKETRVRANYIGVPKPGPKMRGHRDDDITITMRRGVQPRVKGRGAKDRAVIARRQIGVFE